ncbi:MAG: 23S rRNA (pseudouridine(1915)-N(3))-methyltransferase RlmH [Chlorobi bacterium]|nr:23S rRNA (pseudouridine(1915)-N(3))-methyltransferase RlmH [Chlorobiota bacterium]
MVFRIITVSNKLIDFVELAVNHYSKNLKSLGGRLELTLLKRQKRFKGRDDQRRYDTDLLLDWLRRDSSGAMNVILDPEGKPVPTNQLTNIVKQFAKINFIIGSDVGIAKPHQLWSLAHLKISISPWTLSHQVCIVICAEQAWRILSIIKGHPYHK